MSEIFSDLMSMKFIYFAFLFPLILTEIELKRNQNTEYKINVNNE